jgi:predicted Zn finger-like uncharacterized protein
MILTCPQCATRYQTDAALFGAEGRKVRCVKCGNIWHQQAELVAPAEPESVPQPDPEPAPPPPRRAAYAPAAYSASESDAEEDAPQPSARAQRQPPIDWGGRAGVAAGWIGLAVLVLVIGWSGMRFRQEIATLWPQSASLYAALGKPVNTTGLAIGHVSYRNETQDGQPVLAITGQLTNITTHEILVPPIRVTLTDNDKRVLYNWTFSANVAWLKSGQTVKFVTRLSSPPSGARHLQVRLAGIAK